MATFQISEEEYNRLLDFIMDELRAKGMKSTTMDSIAASYKISKRTLYEIFDNKEHMIEEAIGRWHTMAAAKYAEIHAGSSSIMETILKCFLFNRDYVRKTSLNFFRDFHAFAKQRSDKSSKKKLVFQDYISGLLQKGVEEGYFRDDINIPVQSQMITIQMESMRRMEELFPENLSLVEIFDSIIITFLRGISTQKGIMTLDKILKEIN